MKIRHFKSNNAFTRRIKELHIKFDDVLVGVQRLREKHGNLIYDEKKLVIGSVYFDKLEQSGIKLDPVPVRVLGYVPGGGINPV